MKASESTYTGSGTISSPVYEWQHSISEIVNGLIGAGSQDRVPARIPVLILSRCFLR